MIAALTARALHQELGALCTRVEFLRSWWQSANDVISAKLGGLITSRIHDHFIEAAISARIVARAAGIKVDRPLIDQQDWHVPGVSRRAHTVTPAPVAIHLGGSFMPVGDGQMFRAASPLTDEEIHEELERICTHVEYLLSWWEAQRNTIGAVLGERATNSINYRFTDAAISARIIAGAASVEVDHATIGRKDWHAPDPVPRAPAVGPAPALAFLGGNLGLADRAHVSISTQTPTGRVELALEVALRHIDEYAEPGRTRILLCLPYYYNFDEVTA